MSDEINLADPAFEPTDEQLRGLFERAFSGVTSAHESALQRMRQEIAERSKVVLEELEKRLASDRGPE